MPGIGSPELLGGQGDQFIGSFADPGALYPEAFLGLREEDLWLYRDENRNILQSLELATILPGNTTSKEITIQYRGYNPVMVLGFYLRPLPEFFYQGRMSPVADKETLLYWADYFTPAGAVNPQDFPGIGLSQLNIDTQLEEFSQFKSTSGDLEETPVPFLGATNGILRRDQEFTVTLWATAPTDGASKQISQAYKLHFGFEINANELTDRELQLLGFGGGCQ